MNTLIRFWHDDYAVRSQLESDTWLRRFLQKHVVAAFMNRFPNAATKLFSRSRGELARLLFREDERGSYRTLRSMYRVDAGHDRGDMINRVLMQSPAVKAARNRRRITQRMLQLSLEALPEKAPKLVLAIGGGDGRLEAEVIARTTAQRVYYCGVDQDERAVAENADVLRRHGLVERGFTYTGTVTNAADVKIVLSEASRRYGVPFGAISVTVCQGIVEYLDINSQENSALSAMLGALHECTRAEGSLIISQTDIHDRVEYLEKGLSWYMRLRSRDELATEVRDAGWQISTCEHEPMQLITMCLAAKSDVGCQRLEIVSPLRRPHFAEGNAPGTTQRRVRGQRPQRGIDTR